MNIIDFRKLLGWLINSYEKHIILISYIFGNVKGKVHSISSDSLIEEFNIINTHASKRTFIFCQI